MRIISILLTVVLMLSLCACKKTEKAANSSDIVTSQTTSEKTSSKKPQNTSSKVDPEKCKHKFSAVTIAATCTQDGRVVKSCGKCGFSEEKIIESQGHIMILGKCGNCDYMDTVDNVKAVANWINTNANGKYVLRDKRYYIRTIGQELHFYFKDNDSSLCISVYGKEDNICFIEYAKGESTIEGNFPMEWVYSGGRRYFEKMSGANDSELQSKMADELIFKIDTVLKTFDEVLTEKMDISIANIGFTAFELEKN